MSDVYNIEPYMATEIFEWVGLGGGRTNGRNGGDDFSELQFIQDGSFTGGILSVTVSL